jgi:hypothetical protein
LKEVNNNLGNLHTKKIKFNTHSRKHVPMGITFMNIVFLAGNVFAQTHLSCPDYQQAEDVLSTCNFPPLAESRAFWPNSSTVHKNPFTNVGPNTAIIANKTSASCLCSDGRVYFNDTFVCEESLTIDGMPLGPEWDLTSNVSSNAELYMHDCQEWGYFADPIQAYPSTTRTSLPSDTISPTPTVSGCSLCDVVAAQVNECGLLPWNTNPQPANTNIPIVDGESHRIFLYNRTAGECVCTLPVLRSMPGCLSCIYGKMFGGSNLLFSGLLFYINDCGTLGYYPDQTIAAQASPSATITGGKTSDATGLAIPSLSSLTICSVVVAACLALLS